MSTQYKITKEAVEAALIPALTDQGWQQLLHAASGIPITRETLTKAYSDFLKLRGLHEWLKKRLEEENREDKERMDTRKEAYHPVMKQIEDILASADVTITKLNDEIMASEKAIGAKIAKQNELVDKLTEFVKETTRQIILSKTSKELGKIQMRVGSEKSKRHLYEIYESILTEACNSLLGLIEERKDVLKHNSKLEMMFEALKTTDIVKANEIKGEIEHNSRIIQENATNLVNSIFTQISPIQKANNDIISEAIKPRLHRWSWEVDDIELLYKRHPEFVEKIPNKKAINAFMKQKEIDGVLNKDEDNLFNGLNIYYKPFYVEI